MKEEINTFLYFCAGCFFVLAWIVYGGFTIYAVYDAAASPGRPDLFAVQVMVLLDLLLLAFTRYFWKSFF